MHPRAPVGWPHHGRYTSLKKPYFTYYCGVHGCVIVEAPIGWWSYRQIWIVHQRTGFDGSEGSQPEDLAVGRIRRRMGNLIHSIEFLKTNPNHRSGQDLCDIYTLAVVVSYNVLFIMSGFETTMRPNSLPWSPLLRGFWFRGPETGKALI